MQLLGLAPLPGNCEVQYLIFAQSGVNGLQRKIRQGRVAHLETTHFYPRQSLKVQSLG